MTESLIIKKYNENMHHKVGKKFHVPSESLTGHLFAHECPRWFGWKRIENK
jgi:hypothetical protein